MKESLSVRFLYRTLLGRVILKILVLPEVSKVAGCFLDSRYSKKFIPAFIKNNNIDKKTIEVPEGGFESFNAFFSRKRTKKYTCEEGTMISPCDAFLSVLPIRGNHIFSIKHTRFSLMDLLQNKQLAEKYKDGIALVYRLTPAHYHRYDYAVSGKSVGTKRIDGILHCVRPIVTREIPVFAQNAREYEVIETKDFGTVLQMEVGALMVGRISNFKHKGNSNVVMGDEKGYFEFGGSTIVVLVEKDKVNFSDSICNIIGKLEEIPVTQGEVIGRKN